MVSFLLEQRKKDLLDNKAGVTGEGGGSAGQRAVCFCQLLAVAGCSWHRLCWARLRKPWLV